MKPVLTIFLLVILFNSAYSGPLGPDKMRELHGKIKHVISRPVSENPIYLVAEDKHHFESSEAALYFPQDFDEISAALSRIENWCEILPLHMNVKACTYGAGGDELILYLGSRSIWSSWTL